jgi:DNA-binding IscR family transcriptional regulator
MNNARFVLLEPGTGLVLSQRGPDGGFSLARPASEISLAEIVDALSTF